MSRVPRGLRRIVEDGAHPLDRLASLERKVGLGRHVDGHPQAGRRAALADPHLEDPEPPALDRELDVAQVALVPLEPVGGAAKGAGRVRQAAVEGRDRLGRVGSRDDVLALGAEQHVPVQAGLAGRGIAREHDPGRRRVVQIPEHHRLDRDRRPEIVRDPLLRAVRLGAIAVPGAKHGLDGEAQLGPRVVRRLVDADDRPEHRPEPHPAVGRERLVSGRAGEAGLGLVAQPEIQDRVHHPGHRHRRARSDADEERVVGRTEAAPDDRLDLGHPLAQLVG